MTDPRLPSEVDRLDSLAEEFAGRLRAGDRPTIDEYLGRYPEYADRIRELFPAVVAIEQATPAPPAAPPARLGDYRILREIGRGGMGVVYEAVQESIDRPVALKVVRASACGTPNHRDRFLREVRAAGRLHHTNIVPVFGTGEAEGVLYYAMQYIPGTDLDRVLRAMRRVRQVGDVTVAAELALSDRTRSLVGPHIEAATVEARAADTAADLSAAALGSLPADGYFRRVADLVAQAADALAHAHSLGVLHRDVKPSNLLLDVQGRVWVADFGLAKASDQDDLTLTGDTVGTPRYLAPERFRGRADPQSDVYSLGATLYELATLRPAVGGTTPLEVMRAVLEEQPVPPRGIEPRIPADLETVIQTAMAKEPQRRYPTAAALAADLRRFLADEPILARRPTPVERAARRCRQNRAVASLTAGLLLVLVGGVVGLAWMWKGEHDARKAAEVAEGRAQQSEDKMRDDLERLGRANALVDSARRHAYYGRAKEAEADYTRAIEIKPDHSAALAGRGELYFALGLWDRAVPDTLRSAELQPNPSDVGSSREWFQKAAAFALAGDREGYARLRTEILKRAEQRGFFDLRVSMVGQAKEASLTEAATAVLLLPASPGEVDVVAKLATADSPLGSEVAAWKYPYPSYLKGFALYRSGRVDQSLPILEESLRTAPTPEARVVSAVMLALAQCAAGQRQKAAASLAIADQHIDDRILLGRGIPQRHLLREWPESLAFWILYREAKAAVGGPTPDDMRLALTTVSTLYGLGKTGEAETTYAKAVAAHPTDPRYRAKGFYVLGSIGELDRAEAELAAAISLAPKDADLHAEMFRFLVRRKKFDRANTLFAANLLVAPDRRKFLLEAFDLYADADEWDRAESVLAALRVIDLDFGAHRLAKFRYLLTRRKIEEAGKELDRLRASRPDDLKLCEEAASAYWHVGYWRQAEAVLTELIKCDSTRARVWANTALAKTKLGHLDQAAECLGKALQIDPSLSGAYKPDATPWTYSFVDDPPTKSISYTPTSMNGVLRWLPPTIDTIHGPLRGR
jgi:serine/threonine protein kinase/Tfp pilus assembly protein PilF